MEELPDGIAVCSLETGWIRDAKGVKYPALRFHVEGHPEDDDLVVPMNAKSILDLQDALQEILEQTLEDDARGQ